MSRGKMKKENGYKEHFTSNMSGRNRYGESKIIGDKTRKHFSLSIDLTERLADYAKSEGLTQSDVVELAIRKYIKAARAKD